MMSRFSERLPLTLALSPLAGRGDNRGCRTVLRPVYGEKVADRPDEGLVSSRIASSFSGETHAPRL
jgi:hypothetical protein